MDTLDKGTPFVDIVKGNDQLRYAFPLKLPEVHVWNLDSGSRAIHLEDADGVSRLLFTVDWYNFFSFL